MMGIEPILGHQTSAQALQLYNEYMHMLAAMRDNIFQTNIYYSK